MAFTEIQLVTIALTVVIPGSVSIYSNSRITDAKETLRAEIGEALRELRSEFALGFDRLEKKIDDLTAEVTTLQEMIPGHPRYHRHIE